MKIKAGTDISDLFDNLHMHSLAGNSGDKNKISMFPAKELLPLLMAQLQNTLWKIKLVQALSGNGIMLHPDFFVWEFDNGERPAEESIQYMLRESRKFLADAVEKGYSIENARFSKKGLNVLNKKFAYSDTKLKKFVNKVQKEYE